jgi:metallo-beta-lactamase family protein
MQIQFIGACRTVTGSQHLLSVNGAKILLDCGLFQGKRSESFELNTEFEFYDPREIDLVVLSHAHIDHSGNIPQLVKKGFQGKIISTFATADLCKVMLKDSVYIQERDAEFVNKKRAKKNEPPISPMYNQKDAENAIELFSPIKYRTPTEIAENVELIFYDAGHILGSAFSYFKIKNSQETVDFCFLGDLGRPNMAILKDPEKIPTPDIIISESTYGGRFHKPAKETEEELENVIVRARNRRGKIIVPAFSVGRTQQLVLAFHNLFNRNVITKMPIYVDSPLSVNATEVFRKHEECFDKETLQYIMNDEDPFAFRLLNYVRSVEESIKLNDCKEPCIIISASGMAESGRILHHLRNSIEDSRNTILIVGYNAPYTLGRRLVEKEKKVKIFGEEHKVKAEVVVMNSFSAHADRKETLEFFDSFYRKKLKRIYLVHGDYDQQLKLQAGLESAGFTNINIPDRGDTFEI